MKIEFESIGFVKTNAINIPRHWTVSDGEGIIVIDKKYAKDLDNSELPRSKLTG